MAIRRTRDGLIEYVYQRNEASHLVSFEPTNTVRSYKATLHLVEPPGNGLRVPWTLMSPGHDAPGQNAFLRGHFVRVHAVRGVILSREHIFLDLELCSLC